MVSEERSNTSKGAQPLTAVLRDMEERVRAGEVEQFVPISTGFGELDVILGGGFKPGQLILLSGPAGVGKTSLVLQVARNIAQHGEAFCLFACYEHDADYLAQRLICMESVAPSDGGHQEGLRLRDLADLVGRYSRDHGESSFIEAVKSNPRGAVALQRISRYGERLLLLKGSSNDTSTEVLRRHVQQTRLERGGGAPQQIVLFVDYLQKVATSTPHTAEAARNIEVVEALKELALEQQIVVVAITAAEIEGLKAQRMRLHHLLSTADIAYEADVIMLMNEKHDIVDRRHISYNPHAAEQYHQYIVLSIEKNRAGSDLVNLEFRKQLQFCRFWTEIRRVSETLITGDTRG